LIGVQRIRPEPTGDRGQAGDPECCRGASASPVAC
jgi:hypothetical protein